MIVINKDNPILTVAIPTFNRSKYLEKTLNILREQYCESIEILVSDNHSTDDTYQVVSTLQQNMPYLKYHRNEYNMGFDGNIMKLYELTQTPYIWFLGDDDPVEGNAITNILDSLYKYQPTVALFRHSYEDNNGDITLHPSWLTKDRIIEGFCSDADYEAFLSTIFLSVVVVRKNSDVTVEKLAKYKDSAMIHMTLCLLLLSKKFRFCTLTPVIVRHHQGRIYGQDLVLHFLTGSVRALCLPEFGYTIKKFKRLIFSSGHKSCGNMILSSKIGRDIVKFPVKVSRLREIYSVFGISSLPGIIYLLVCIMAPPPIVKALYYLKQNYAYRFKKKFSYSL